MQETDVGRLLAAAAPETVPAIGNLPERARALGKRRRMRRVAVAGTSAGVVAVAGAVFAVGGFGGGAGERGTGVSVAPGTVPATSPDPGATATTSPDPLSSMNGPAMEVSGQSVLVALKAALPADLKDRPTPGTATLGYGDFGANFHWGPKTDGAWLGLDTNDSPSRLAQPGDPCAGVTVHCSTGTGTVQGKPVSWMYNTDGTHAETFLVWGAKTNYGVDYTGPMTGPGSISFAELKDIGLDDGVAAALLSELHALPGN